MSTVQFAVETGTQVLSHGAVEVDSRCMELTR